MALHQQSCVPCRGGIPPLTRAEAEDAAAEIPEWSLSVDATKISRRFSFGDFASALAFVNRVGELAESQGHHPDISFGWGYADVVLFTHKIRGLHANDFIMAAKIDRIS
ncbi:MAG: 4a-hydroxytetrahydrobiopterin dehydratase [Proteobacteria bacterium]|nr:4a-hydroxytetrahydrobiopterin dehydratase [Pseudomonadota bacterium]